MTIQTFIEKAIEGGWKNGILRANPHADVEALIEDGVFLRDLHQTLLDPLAWQAVGKVEGWTEEWEVLYILASQDPTGEDGRYISKPIYNMHRMIDALAEGKTIEEFLQSL